MRRSLATILALGLAVPCGAAESGGRIGSLDPALAEGTRVRIRLDRSRRIPNLPARLEGRVASVDEAGVTLRLNAYQQVSVPADSIARVEVSAGRHSRARGAAAGAGAGALAGALLLGVSAAIGCRGEVSPGACTVALAAIGGAMGAVPGAAIGALVSPGERWEEVPRERLRVTAAPILGRERAGFAVSVSF